MERSSLTYFTIEGFTILELLVAVFIASILFVGVAGFFKQVLLIQDGLLKDRESFSEITRFVNLVSSDVRCSVGGFSVKDDGRRISFITTHTLLYGGSCPVEVSYYVREEDGKEWLVRREILKSVAEELEIPLTCKIKNLKFEVEDLGYYLVKVSFSYMDKKFKFYVRNVIAEK